MLFSMKKILTIAAAFIFISGANGQDDLPYKSSDEFKVITSFQLVTLQPEKKPDYGDTPLRRKKASTEMFLQVVVRIEKVNEEEKIVRAFNGVGLLTTKKKIKEGLELNFDFGSFEKLKSREIPHFFTIFILDKEKQNISKIVIEVLENGAIFVNGKPHGKS